MRYQERIYIQNSNGAVRNKDILNVNMSSDICIFQSPTFNVSGASKLDCTGATTGTSYVVSATTESIPLIFNFTGNTDTFLSTDAVFKFEIYKYTPVFSGFSTTPIFNSEIIEYSAFSATNTTSVNVPVSGLSLDGEYLIKGSYRFTKCTDILNRLGSRIDTANNLGGDEFGIYNKALDYYFIAMNKADTPFLTQNTSNNTGVGTLIQQVILPISGNTSFLIPTGVNGIFVLTLNGLTLSPEQDYTFSGGIVTLNEEMVEDDIISMIYNSAGGFTLAGDNFEITNPIVSGVTDGEDGESVYFNTTTGKYEIYTSVAPVVGNAIIVMVNGATLTSGIDFYQSTTNPKRIILEGYVVVGDLIAIVYYPATGLVNGVSTNTPVISWSVLNAPANTNGSFLVEVGNDSSFTSLYFSATTPYIVGKTIYSQGFTLTGAVGSEYFYRVKNEKIYTTICEDNVYSTAYSEVVPITLLTNSVNSY